MISVSYLKSKYNKLETINKIDESNADLIHVDLMDGIYAGECNFNIDEVLKDLSNVTKKLDIHLMVNDPLEYIKKLCILNPYIITFHLDSCNNIREVIDYIKNSNIKVGIAINPDEDINILNDYYNIIDYVLIMSVYPGKGGQQFITSIIPKLEVLKDKNVLIGIDGGINEDTIKYLNNYRVDIIVSGSFICMSDSFDKQINLLRSLYKSE